MLGCLDLRGEVIDDADAHLLLWSQVLALRREHRAAIAFAGQLQGEPASLQLEQRGHQQCVVDVGGASSRGRHRGRCGRRCAHKAIAQLTSGVAHDFNNLLTVLLAKVELLRHHAGMPDALHPILDDMSLRDAPGEGGSMAESGVITTARSTRRSIARRRSRVASSTASSTAVRAVRHT